MPNEHGNMGLAKDEENRWEPLAHLWLGNSWQNHLPYLRWMKHLQLWHLVLPKNTEHTVDGRNPAPVDIWFIPLLLGFQPSKVVQDFFHPQYVVSGGLEHFLFSIIYGRILPIDFHIFQRGWNHQPVHSWKAIDKKIHGNSEVRTWSSKRFYISGLKPLTARTVDYTCLISYLCNRSKGHM